MRSSSLYAKTSMENEFVRHEPCPSCSSSDAFAVYSDGGGFCFSCGHYRKGDGEEELTSHLTSRKRMITYEGDFARIPS